LADFGGRDRPASEVIMTTHIDRAALRRQIFFWLLAFAVVVAFLMVFRSILLPFIAGMALAYFLDPVADWFERRGFSRLMATFAILIAFIALFAIALIVLIPILVTQAADLGGKIPGYITQLQSLLTSETTLLPGWISSQLDQIKDSFAALLKEGAGLVGTIFQQIWNSGMALLDIAALFVVTPVVAFYLLLDWDNMIEKLMAGSRAIMSRPCANWRRSMRPIAGFVRGQGSVCMILGLIYAVGLSIVGLNFGLLIGLFAGLISFIPYVGSMVGLVLAVVVAIVQFWPDFIMIGAVIACFCARSVFRGQHPAATAGRQIGRPASGLADVRAFCLRRPVRLRRYADRGTRRSLGRRCSCASPCRAISTAISITTAAQADMGTGRWPVVWGSADDTTID
jgi:predicted PurR-regulated permease PerM